MRLAVIPARGGSKRIPRKNIRPFAGKPMIVHSIECALRSGLFERLIVSTDDDEIADVSRRHGADVPFMRPPRLSDDHTGTTEVMAHAVDWALHQAGDLSAVCCIYATAPFLHDDDLKRGLQLLEGGNWQYVFAATTFAFPIHRSFHMRGDGGLEMLFPQHFNTRSQDLPAALHDAGQFYWGRPQAWLRNTRIFDVTSTVVRIPSWRVQDIDTEEDWVRAELISKVLGMGGERPMLQAYGDEVDHERI